MKIMNLREYTQNQSPCFIRDTVQQEDNNMLPDNSADCRRLGHNRSFLHLTVPLSPRSFFCKLSDKKLFCVMLLF